MNAPTYQLIDFGMGRKLESLGDYRIDRPSPAADHAARHSPVDWAKVDAKFDENAKRWKFYQPWPDDLTIDCGPFKMPVRPTPYGHIGLFPEQHANWQWLAQAPGSSDSVSVSDSDQASIAESPAEADEKGNADESQQSDPLLGLNLFGYTGASTMAMVAAGLAVAHVDAAKPNVESARESAARNDWQDKPIRYLVDDAAKFAAREVRRDRRYHTIVLDPPAYGHGPAGKTWRVERDLWPLLESCFALLRPDRAKMSGKTASTRLLITGHSPDVTSEEIVRFIRSAKPLKPASLRIDADRSELETPEGRKLNAGFSVRVTLKWSKRN
ncbi:class I SAM-dependent methyltransferase [Rubripirellula amarantea]|nr:class I SAM-dependent methyltransferase [Rubripirellula amarantea]